MARLASFALLLSLVLAPPSLAAQHQGIANAGDKPRFLAGWVAPGRKVDASNSAVLQRRISLDVTRAALGTVLRELARQSRLDLTYDPTTFPATRTVSLHVREITMLAALTEVLVNTGFDVLVQRGGQLALVPATGDVGLPRRVDPGVLHGKVTDAKTGDGLGGVEILLEGTRLRTTTSEKGYYRLAGVEAGSYTLTIRRVGYAKQSRVITVAADQELQVDVALQPVPTMLDELVTTVTGEQRVRELGHVIGRINADSVMKEAPVSSLSQLLNARVPGLQVFTNSGVVGGTVRMQIRSANSVYLASDPIVIIDGVRYTTTPRGTNSVFSVEETSRLNDINPNDIASIEVVKGPSAATLYGTDAAGGVLVITTKRGRVGQTHWNGYFRGTRTGIPQTTYDDNYWGWGTVFGTPNASSSCTLAYIAGGFCTQQDSVVVVPNPLNDPDYMIFHNQPSWQYGLNVNGGRQEFRYYFSGDYDDETGPFQMPREALERLKQAKGVSEIPDDELRPNATARLNLRANVSAAVAPTADLSLNTGYSNNVTRTISEGVYRATASATPTNPYGSDPEDVFRRSSAEHLDRFIGSVVGRWRPMTQVEGRATIGLDLANTDRVELSEAGASPAFPDGLASNERSRQLSVSGDLGLSATLRRGRATFRTSVGAQYVRSLGNHILAMGFGLPPGGESPGQATSYYVRQQYDETATLGGYAEETVGLNDRLFLTGALRVDGATAFGSDYSAATYPKVSVSWIVSDEPFMPRPRWLDELRLRYAFGASGRQATMDMTLPRFSVTQAVVDGQVVNIFYNDLGNPNLKPERVREHEIGLDAGLFAGRARLGLTWFKRKTTDPIVNRDLAPGFGHIYTNFGLITGHGFEAELSLRPIESRLLNWQLTFNHSIQRSVLVDLGGLTENKYFTGGWVEGYSLGARFVPKILGYNDANQDGIIVISEIQMSAPQYAGESTPPSTQTLTSAFGLFDQRLRLSALFERRTGYTQVNQLFYDRCYNLCKEMIDITTPLADQVDPVAMVYSGAYRPVEDGTFVRFRELTAAVDMPDRIARAMRVRSAALSLSVRNLALWSSFSGPDAESAPVSPPFGQVASGAPQARTYVLRFDLGL